MIKVLVYSIICLTGIVLCIQDILYRKIEVWIVSVFVISCFSLYFFGRAVSCIPCCIYLVIGAIYYCMLKKHAFGAADYLVIAAISFLIQENDWPLFLVINGGIGTLIGVYVKHKNEKTIPFIPVIMLSVLLTNIVNILR